MKASRKASRTARQLFRLCMADGHVDEARVRQVARRLAESKRRGSLAVLSDFQRLVRLERDRHTALVESATPLTDDVRRDLQESLKRRYGSALDTAFTENPDLIGGMRIKVGSDVYDGSVRARLAALASSL
jgi:F-type H+-transporting ATPase subunit delta